MAGLRIDADTASHAAHDNDLAALDRKIARLEHAAGDQISRLLANGLDPIVAANATQNLTEQLTAARTRRQRLIEWQAANTARRDRTVRLLELADHARHHLTGADRSTRARVIALLDISVTVTGWDRCSTCDGKGLLPTGLPRRRSRKGPARAITQAPVCHTCRRHRWLPRLVIEGTVPETDLDSANPPGDTERWPFTVIGNTA